MSEPTSLSSARLRWSGVLLIAAFVGVTYGFGIYVFSQLLPVMSSDLGLKYSQAGLVTALGQFLFIIFAVIATWLATKVNGAWIVLGSGVLCAVCLLTVSATSNIIVLTISLGVAAGTSASVYVPIVTLVPKLVGSNRSGTALGIISSGTTYGVFISAAVIPMVTVHFGWRYVWLLVGMMSLVLALVAYRVFAKLGLFAADKVLPRADSGPRFNYRGLLAGLALWMVGIWLIKFMNGFSFMSYQNFLAPLLNDFGGQTLQYSSSVWLVISVVGAISGFAVGYLADRIGIKVTLMMCYVAFLASCLIVALTQAGPGPLLAAVLFGVSFYPVYGLVPAYVSKIATGLQATIVFGFANAFQGGGGIVGNVVAGRVADDLSALPSLYVLLGCGALLLAIGTLLLPSDRRRTAPMDEATGARKMPTGTV